MTVDEPLAQLLRDCAVQIMSQHQAGIRTTEEGLSCALNELAKLRSREERRLSDRLARVRARADQQRAILNKEHKQKLFDLESRVRAACAQAEAECTAAVSAAAEALAQRLEGAAAAAGLTAEFRRVGRGDCGAIEHSQQQLASVSVAGRCASRAAQQASGGHSRRSCSKRRPTLGSSSSSSSSSECEEALSGGPVGGARRPRSGHGRQSIIGPARTAAVDPPPTSLVVGNGMAGLVAASMRAGRRRFTPREGPGVLVSGQQALPVGINSGGKRGASVAAAAAAAVAPQNGAHLPVRRLEAAFEAVVLEAGGSPLASARSGGVRSRLGRLTPRAVDWIWDGEAGGGFDGNGDGTSDSD